MFENFELQVKLVHPNAKVPTRANSGDAGLDIYTPTDVVIAPFADVKIDTGLITAFPHGYALVIKNKSGVATKKKLVVGACVAGDTLIRTSKGLFPAVTLTKDFLEKNDISVLSYNTSTKSTSYEKCDGFRVSGTKETMCLYFDDGRELVCSEDHMILTNNGWVAACDIDETYEIVSM